MSIIEEQVREINDAFGHADEVEAFGASPQLRQAGQIPEAELSANLVHEGITEKRALYANLVRWVTWYVDNICKRPFEVAPVGNGDSMLRGEKSHMLPSLRDTSLRDALDGIGLTLVEDIAETARAAKERDPRLMKREVRDGVSQTSRHLSGGNTEGILLVANALGTYFEAEQPDAPEAAVRTTVAKLGRDVMAGMKNSFDVERIVDAMILTGIHPYSIIQDQGQTRLVYNDKTMRFLREIGRIASGPRTNYTEMMSVIVDALTLLEVDGISATTPVARELFTDVVPAWTWSNHGAATFAASPSLHRVRTSMVADQTVQDCLVYLGVIAYDQCHQQGDEMMTLRLGCPLHHTGKFGKWYLHIAKPMTDWYLQQRAFQTQAL